MNFLPYSFAGFLAVIATIVEITGGFLLLTGLFTRWAAYGCSILTFCFAVAMAISSYPALGLPPGPWISSPRERGIRGA